MIIDKDVLVIGGGAIGTSIAYQLAKEKVDVTLVEKGEIASGATSHCDGFLFLQSKKPGTHLRLAMESANIFPSLVKEFGYDIEYERKGGLIIIQTEEEEKVMENFARRQRKTGLDVEFLDTQETRKLEPTLSKNIIGATYNSLDGQVNPIYLAFGFANAASRLGAKICRFTEVQSIKEKSNYTFLVSTNRGEIKARFIVDAAGVCAPLIGNMLGINIPIKPKRGQILVSEVMPRLIKRPMLSARYMIAKFNPNPKSEDELIRLGVGLAIEQTQNGNILIGSTREFVGFDERVTYPGMRAISRHALSVFPNLKNINIIRSFAGLRPYTPDGLPILGKVKEIEGFIIAAGHEGDGIMLAPATGKIIANIILEKKISYPVKKIALSRFSKSYETFF
jgi:sarcosine oxidase subunit beta